jgi:hypothetical protein
VREDVGRFELSICGRHRVYPQEPSQTVTLNTGAGADQFGSWTEIVPANIVPFIFTIVGVLIETISATGIYHVQIGDCNAGGTPGANDIQGEMRLRGTAPINRSTELIPFGSRDIAANRRVMGRVKNDSGGDNVTVSVVIRRYVAVSEEIEKYPAFPW